MCGMCAGPPQERRGRRDARNYSPAGRVVARLIRTSESLWGLRRLEGTQGSMPSMPAKAPAPPITDSALGGRLFAAGPCGRRLGSGLIVLVLVAVLLSAPRAAAATF